MLLTRSLGEAAQRVASGDLRPVDAAAAAPAGSVLASLGLMQQKLARSWNRFAAVAQFKL